MSAELQQLETALATLEAQRSLLGDAVVDIALGPIRARLEAIRAQAATVDVAQRPAQTLKQVSILFLDIVGSTSLALGLDPEEVSDVMDGALSRGTTIVDAHRGRVLQYAGDSMLAAFGTDVANEDDAESAVRCGLALLELGKLLGAEVRDAYDHEGFDVRVGVHTGGVLLGGGVDAADSIRGIAVNVAARMEQTAPPGALRISQDTYAQVRGVFDVLPQEPLSIKGIDTPVTSYLVQRLKPRAFRVETRGIEGVATRMIGRDHQLAVLQDAFERLVRPGAGLQRVDVVADAGVGKSRLLYEFRNWAETRPERFFVFQARATPQTQGQAYGLLRDMLAWRLQIADDDSMDVAKQKLEFGLIPLFVADDGEQEAEAHAHLLGQLIGLDYSDSRHIRGILADGRQIRSRGFHAAAKALRRVATQAGVVMYLDDLHWADDASLDFIEYVMQTDRDVPLLIIGLTRATLFERRPASASLADTIRIDLQPLDKTGSRQLADELLKKLPDIPAALRELLTGGADGNPFYMEELVKMLVDQGAIRTTDEQWTLDGGKLLALKVPSTLTGVLQARLDGLPPAERQALQLASVVGPDFWDAAVAHIEPKADERLPPLAQRELVTRKDVADRTDEIHEYAFRHQILHQVTYDTVLRNTKREAHAKTAQWVAEHSGVRSKALLGTAAEHYERAGDLANAAEFYARAAAHAASTFANEVALDYTARALKIVPENTPELRWRLLATRERTLDLLGKRTEQMDDIEGLLALAEALDDDGKRAEAAWRRSDIALRKSDWSTQEHEARRAKRLAESVGNEELTLRAIQRLSTAIARNGDPATARAMAEAGLARAQVLGWLGSQVRLANSVAICTAIQDDKVGGVHYATLCLSLSRQAEDRRSEAIDLSNLGAAHGNIGDYGPSQGYLDEALRLNRSLGNRQAEGNILNALSEIAWRQREYDLAVTHARAAIEIQTEIGSRHHLVDALKTLGNAELALGHRAEAEAAFERSESLAREVGQAAFVRNALEARTRIALERRDDAEAIELVSKLLTEAGLDPRVSAGEPTATQPHPFEGEAVSAVRLTMYRVWSRVGDPRADIALALAYQAVQAEADTINDAVMKQSFLHNIAEHREITALWEANHPIS